MQTALCFKLANSGGLRSVILSGVEGMRFSWRSSWVGISAMAPHHESAEQTLRHNTDEEKGDQMVPPGVPKDVSYFGAAAIVNENRHSDRILVLLRLFTFAFAVAAVVLMATNSHTISGSTVKVRWYSFDSYRYVLAVSAIIGTYSLVETGLGLWLLQTGTSFMPESFAVWFDYGHDQGFAYLLFSAATAGAAIAQGVQTGKLKIEGIYTCHDAKNFCFQAKLSIGMAFASFICLGASALLSGYRVAKWFMGLEAPE